MNMIDNNLDYANLFINKEIEYLKDQYLIDKHIQRMYLMKLYQNHHDYYEMVKNIENQYIDVLMYVQYNYYVNEYMKIIFSAYILGLHTKIDYDLIRRTNIFTFIDNIERIIDLHYS